MARVRKRARSAGLLSLGVRPEYQGRGIGSILVATALRAAADLGFERVEYALVAENNEPSKATALRFGGKLCRTFGIYAQALG
jgi:ribosomal protein S18 acetylase RimI-like enzyme